MVIVVAALDSELAGIRRHLELADAFHVGEVRMEHGRLGGRDCVLVQSGMGRQRAEQALRAVLAQYHPVAVLSLGFCGAVAATLRVGDLVVCSPVGALLTLPSGPHAGPSPVGWLHSDGALAQQALAAPMPPGAGGRRRWSRRAYLLVSRAAGSGSAGVLIGPIHKNDCRTLDERTQ